VGQLDAASASRTNVTDSGGAGSGGKGCGCWTFVLASVAIAGVVFLVQGLPHVSVGTLVLFIVLYKFADTFEKQDERISELEQRNAPDDWEDYDDWSAGESRRAAVATPGAIVSDAPSATQGAKPSVIAASRATTSATDDEDRAVVESLKQLRLAGVLGEDEFQRKVRFVAVRAGLTSLGHERATAGHAAEAAISKLGYDAPIEELVREALKSLQRA
jgi:hypothetical protein